MRFPADSGRPQMERKGTMNRPAQGRVAQDLWSAVSPTCSRQTPEALVRENLLCACRLEACDTADQRSALPRYGSWRGFLGFHLLKGGNELPGAFVLRVQTQGGLEVVECLVEVVLPG